MDTHSTDLPLPSAEPLRHLVEQVLAGRDAVVTGVAGARLLDDAADRLAGERCRVLRVSAAVVGGLSLSGLMAQVTGHSDLTAQDDQVLKRVFQALTVLDPDCDRIVLLVSDAQGLQQPALRYIHFASRVGTALQLVLASEHGLPDSLGAEAASLQARLAACPVITAADTTGLAGSVPVRPIAIVPAPLPVARDITPVPPPVAQAVTPVPRPQQAVPPLTVPPRPALSRKPATGPKASSAWRRSWVPVAAIGAGMVACIVLGIVIGRRDWSTPIDTAPALSAPQVAAIQPDTPRGATEPDRAAASSPAPTSPSQAALEDLPVPPPYLPESPRSAAAARSSAAPAAQNEVRARDTASVRRSQPRIAGRAPEYRNPAPEVQDTSDGPFMSSRPLWQPPRADPPPSRAGETRAIGTYTVDENGMRVFRLSR